MRTFEISWEGYPGNPKPETHDQSWFSADMGFDANEREKIAELAVGEEHTIYGPLDSATIRRLT